MKPLWICTYCKFPQYKNKTVCYNCTKRRDYKNAPEQLNMEKK